MSIYKHTATKSNKGLKKEKVYAFGRSDHLDGRPVEEGGYIVWKLVENYDGMCKDGIRKTWRYVEKNLGYNEAVKLMNKRLGYKAFPERDIK